MREPEDELAVVNRAQRSRGAVLIVLAVVLGALTVGVGIAVDQADSAKETVRDLREQSVDRDTRIENLEKTLNAQRAQFQACKDKAPGTPGCTSPIAPPPSDIGPQGAQGIQGISGMQGPIGRTGRQGSQGLQGVPGADGRAGANGNDGAPGAAGSPGADGSPGPAGKDGATGAQGPEGKQGPEGPQGPAGPAGQNGKDAPTITRIFFGSNPADCQLVVEMSDGASYAAAAPAVFCTA